MLHSKFSSRGAHRLGTATLSSDKAKHTRVCLSPRLVRLRGSVQTTLAVGRHTGHKLVKREEVQQKKGIIIDIVELLEHTPQGAAQSGNPCGTPPATRCCHAPTTCPGKERCACSAWAVGVLRQIKEGWGHARASCADVVSLHRRWASQRGSIPLFDPMRSYFNGAEIEQTTKKIETHSVPETTKGKKYCHLKKAGIRHRG